MATTMIRVERSTHKKLRSLAERTGDSMPELIAAAVEEYERKLFWEQVNEEFTALRNDPKGWKQELEERAAWDVTLSDGLER
jgi:predicted transcriptional regulator